MQRPRPDGKDSAASNRSQSSAPRVDVIVLTADSALLATLREAAGPGLRIFHAESPAAAVDLLIGGHCGIFVVDVALVQAEVVELIEKLQAQFPEVLLLATGQREQQQAVAALVGDGRIYRFLHKPISPARAELFLSAATSRYGELHPHVFRGSRPSAAPLENKRDRRVLWFAAALVLISIAIALARWWIRASNVPPAPQTVAESAPASETLNELLARGDAAFAAGNLAPPAPDNAFDAYRIVLRLDPANERAMLAMQRIVAHYEGELNAALAARDVPRARNAYLMLQRLAPKHPRLEELRAALIALSREVSAPRR